MLPGVRGEAAVIVRRARIDRRSGPSSPDDREDGREGDSVAARAALFIITGENVCDGWGGMSAMPLLFAAATADSALVVFPVLYLSVNSCKIRKHSSRSQNDRNKYSFRPDERVIGR